MRKNVLIFSIASVLFLGSLKIAVSQEQPNPKKDTVNIDTDAKPTFYYAEEEKKDSKSNSGTIGIIAGIVIVVGAAAYFIMKKKK